MATSDISVVLSAVDKITAPLNAIQRRIERISEPLGRFGRSISEIGSAAGFGRLTHSIGRVGSALGSVTRQVGVLGAGLGAIGGIAVAGTLGVTKSVADIAKEIQNLSTVSGMSPEVFQKLAYGARSVGVESDKLGDILKDVNDKIGDFRATGGGEMADFFEKIAPKVGLSIKSFRDLSSADALQLYVRGLERANVSQAEMTFYLESIADDASLLAPLLRDGAKGFHELSREAERTGAILSEEELQRAADYRAAVAGVEARFRAFRNAFGVGLMGPIEDAISAVTQWTDANRDLIRTNIDEWAARIGNVFRDLVDPASDLRVEIAGIGERLAGWVDRLKPVVDFLGGPMNTALLTLGAVSFGPLLASLASLTAAVATLGITLLGTPLGWFMAGVAAIGAAGYIIWRDWDQLPQQFADMWAEIVGSFRGAEQAVQSAGAWINGVASRWYADIDAWLADTEAQLWAGGVAFVQSLWDGMKAQWAALAAWVDSSFASIKTKVVSLGSGIVDAIVEGISSQWGRLTAFLREQIDALTSFMPDWMRDKLGFTASVDQSVTQTTQSLNETVERTTSGVSEAAAAPGRAVADVSKRTAFDGEGLSSRVVPSVGIAPIVPVPSMPDPARFGPTSSPASIETSTVSADRVDVSNLAAPEPFVLHEPKTTTVNAPFNGGAVYITAQTDIATIRSEIAAAFRQQANEHRANILSSLDD